MPRSTLLTIAFAAALAGCGDAQTQSPSASRPATAASTATAKSHCVICGPSHQMDIDAATRTAEFNGKRYYFCSDHCKETFDKDPAQWAARDARP